MTKKMWIGLTLIALGLAVAATAYFQEGIPGRVYWNNGAVYLSDKEDKAQADVTPDSVMSYKEEVKRLQVSSKGADIVIRKGDRFSVVVDRPEKPYITVSAMDGLVKVTGDEHSDWSLGVGNTTSHRIIIEVPSDVTLNQLDLVNASGDLTVKNVKANEMLLQNSAGNINVSDCKVEQSGFVVSRSGDITFKKTALPKVKAFSRFGDLSISSDYQNVAAKDATFSASSSNGDITLK
ncbi:DUF4097 domain-containing protein [Fructobacillus sp. W13]|uniref:DUF4097 domain-containing protein n=1 Tax=Fructobacillus apis TaxID=2935017 RepID=A0ABT0ZQG1_9LACO|nr:DUF4097 family beta strand repeat-containing protein [Fructobacillus apis]MCO0832236.1 DUF4097 domain-containing protein [Fructobacillus apis]